MKHPDGSALMADYELRRIEEGAISVPLSKQVLLLGTSDVGKSTLLRQLQIMRWSSGHPRAPARAGGAPLPAPVHVSDRLYLITSIHRSWYFCARADCPSVRQVLSSLLAIARLPDQKQCKSFGYFATRARNRTEHGAMAQGTRCAGQLCAQRAPLFPQ